MDSSRINALGWQAKDSLADGLARAYQEWDRFFWKHPFN